MIQKNVILKPGKEKAIRQHHHWIFSGAVESLPNFKNGDILPVLSSKNEPLGYAYFNKNSGIIGRMISFDQSPPLNTLFKNIDQAIEMRKRLIDTSSTNAYRIINGEGDRIPGLIIDKYDTSLVIQVSTLGIEKMKSEIVDYLIKKCSPKTIYEKSTLSVRKEEGLSENCQGYLYGDECDEIYFKENKLNFCASLSKSQKTGFFLDHRHMRSRIQSLAHNKRVLNAFSYTGGFSVYAMAGGARAVESVDISLEALEGAKKNMKLNNFEISSSAFIAADVFQFLRDRERLDYDIVILDPPAFAKRRTDVVAACRGYKDINRLALQKMPSGSILLTSSCSHHVDEKLFQQVLFQAAIEAKREVKIIGRHELAVDHPINIYHPESEYLKSALLFVE